ncbi:hypothetical protein ACOSQ3_018788 [Xanthoceras sorbifolium]
MANIADYRVVLHLPHAVDHYCVSVTCGCNEDSPYLRLRRRRPMWSGEICRGFFGLGVRDVEGVLGYPVDAEIVCSDSAVRSGNSSIGVGAVIRDSDGFVVTEVDARNVASSVMDLWVWILVLVRLIW